MPLGEPLLEAAGSHRSVLLLLCLIGGLVAVAQSTNLPVEASGGEIRVVGTRQNVNYPSGVGLTVTVESEAEVKEVRVYYRATGSRQWGYAYADFDPGTRVVATQSIPVSEATYIAPGADVEYYFDIRDVKGNRVRTDSAVVEYLDHNFEWRRTSIGPLELLYHDMPDSRIEEAAVALREDLRRVEYVLQMEHSRGFKGVIYKSYADANAAFPVQSQTTTDHGTFGGYAFPEQRVFVGQGLDRRIIVHESAHMLLHEALGHRVVELPDWLNEGFATYMEPDVRVRSSSQLHRRTPHLRAMKNLSGTPETIPLFYQKSVSVVAHLIEEYGLDKFRLLLDEIRRGRTIETALINVYGFDDHGLDNSWAGLPVSDVEPVSREPVPQRQAADPEETAAGRESRAEAERDSQPAGQSRETQPGSDTVREEWPTAPPWQPEPRNSEGPSPFVFFDAWILAGVALLAVAVLSAKFVYNRLRREPRSREDQGYRSGID